jgi:hypothetical protein
VADSATLRGWRATFYTSGIGALADERDRHRAGAYALARDAAGGVGRLCGKALKKTASRNVIATPLVAN